MISAGWNAHDDSIKVKEVSRDKRVSLGANSENLSLSKYCVYIMNSPTGALYTGVTNDLMRRIYEHKHKVVEGFTKTYNVTRLAYFEETTDVDSAIAREKQIKAWRRSKKIELIKSMNPTWRDLAEDWYEKVQNG
jgi:putative endonuclease